jgi:hypothetical protein
MLAFTRYTIRYNLCLVQGWNMHGHDHNKLCFYEFCAFANMQRPCNEQGVQVQGWNVHCAYMLMVMV